MDALRAVTVPVLQLSRWTSRGRRGAAVCREVAARRSHPRAAGRPSGAARPPPGPHTLAAPSPLHSACSRQRLRHLGPPLAKKGASEPAPEPVVDFDGADDGLDEEENEEEYDELRVYLLR